MRAHTLCELTLVSLSILSLSCALNYNLNAIQVQGTVLSSFVLYIMSFTAHSIQAGWNDSLHSQMGLKVNIHIFLGL